MILASVAFATQLDAFHHLEHTVHFVFISTVLGNEVGGTETLMARMSKWLVGNGHPVTVVANSVKECGHLFDSRVKLVGRRDLDECCYSKRCRRIWPSLGIRKPDVLKSFDLTAAWISSIVGSQLEPAAKLMFGNYYPRIFPARRWHPFAEPGRKLLLLGLARCFADSSLLCMSSEQIASFRERFGTARQPNFWPLPVSVPRQDAPVRRKPGHIVSIGRLDPMKEYNLYLIDIVKRLRDRGLPITWSVYGDGVLREKIRSRIAELGLTDSIHLMGTIPYDRFATALQDAEIFVGMGTAMVEAGMCGVPCAVALAHDTTGVSYGPLYRLQFGNIGELMEFPPDTTVEAEIQRISALSDSDYAVEAKRTQTYARQYDLEQTMRRFIEFAGNAGTAIRQTALFPLYYGYGLAKQLWPRVQE